MTGNRQSECEWEGRAEVADRSDRDRTACSARCGAVTLLPFRTIELLYSSSPLLFHCLLLCCMCAASCSSRVAVERTALLRLRLLGLASLPLQRSRHGKEAPAHTHHMKVGELR